MIVVSKLSQRQPVCPVILAMAHKNPEIGLDLLVYSLHLSVHLQVVCSGGVSWILRSAASSLEKLDTKALPLSLMIASGSPWCLQTCSRTRFATPAESTVVMVGMAWMCLDSLSTTTRMALYPLDSSSSPMVSTGITSQQWVGIQFGVSFPTFCVGKDLQWLQTLHPAI